MIQLAHTSSGIRRSHSVESQKFKSKFLQCLPKDWPAPSKGWTCCFYNFFSAEDDLDFEDPPSFLTSQIERIFWWAAISSFSALTFSTLKVYVRQSSEDNQGQTAKEGLKFSNVPLRLKSILCSSGILLLLQGDLHFCLSWRPKRSKEHHKVSTK